jgi:outer membrane protein insertion porin family
VAYRLGEIHFKNEKQFSAAELRRLFPIHDGEIFNVDKIGQGIQAIREAYGDLGFIDFTAVPDTTTDENQRIFLNVDLDEGPQFHIAGIKVLGKKQKLISPLLRQYKVEPGEVFDQRRMGEFSREVGIHPEDDVMPFIDEKNATVCLVITFRSSSN